MTCKSTEELYSEYVVLLWQLNKKQGKLIEKLSEELRAAKDSAQFSATQYYDCREELTESRIVAADLECTVSALNAKIGIL